MAAVAMIKLAVIVDELDSFMQPPALGRLRNLGKIAWLRVIL